MSVILSKVRANVWTAADTVGDGMASVVAGIKSTVAEDGVEGEGEGERDEEFDDVLANGEDRIVLTYAPLDERLALEHVRDAAAGASVLFVGSTRNTFEGKSVERLEYTSYSSMARKMLTKLIEAQRAQGGDSGEIKRIYVAHRLGLVAAKEASILVCVSSAHRKAAFVACEQVLEEVKRSVPIWKKEVYAGEHTGQAEWKANARTRWKNGKENDTKTQA